MSELFGGIVLSLEIFWVTLEILCAAPAIWNINDSHATRSTKLVRLFTPLKTNMSPQNQWLEDEFPTEIVPFADDMLVNYL